MTVRDFSFAAHARDFDRHIRDSIPGLDDLRAKCVGLSRQSIENGTTVIDIGCSAGALLRAIRDANQPSRPSVRYLGIDRERSFGAHWRKWRTRNVGFRVCDARSFEGFENLSFAYSLFTFGFIPERDRPDLLRRIHDGLNLGGLFIIAEKVLANSAYFEDILTFDYYDFKRRRFSAEEILDKERSLRGQMSRWTEAEWLNALFEAGFQPEQVHPVWQNHLFIAWMARKSTSRKSAGIVPVRTSIVRPAGLPKR